MFLYFDVCNYQKSKSTSTSLLLDTKLTKTQNIISNFNFFNDLWIFEHRNFRHVKKSKICIFSQIFLWGCTNSFWWFLWKTEQNKQNRHWLSMRLNFSLVSFEICWVFASPPIPHLVYEPRQRRPNTTDVSWPTLIWHAGLTGWLVL